VKRTDEAQRQSNNAAALALFQDSLRRAEAVSATELVIAALEGLGSVYESQKDYSEALECFSKALNTAQTIGDRIRMTELYWREGQLYYDRGIYAEASAAANRAYDLATELRSPLLGYLTLTLSAKCYRAQKQSQLAVRSAAQAIEAVEGMRGQIAGADSQKVANRNFCPTRVNWVLL
jgi:tetratricopeptide (TPR) repeat protein